MPKIYDGLLKSLIGVCKTGWYLLGMLLVLFAIPWIIWVGLNAGITHLRISK